MKPVLIGMNNPYGADPHYALYPQPDGCAGHRLWKMLHEECGASMVQYRDSFDRMNLVTGPWDAKRAKLRAVELRVELATRTVVLLGGQVRDAFGHKSMDGVYREFGLLASDIDFYQVPHPSGRNLWYNDEANRKRVGQLFASLYRQSQEIAQ